jgi:hypothetical protein
MIERLRMFRLGWQRRSMLILDAAGTPLWLNRWLCRPTKQEQRAWAELSRWAAEQEPIEEGEEDRRAIGERLDRYLK